MKKANPLKYVLFSVCFALVFLSGASAQAKSSDGISVFHSDGTVFAAKPLFFEANILPGDQFMRKFFVKKKDRYDQVLMMRFKRRLTAKQNILARKINVRLKRVSDGKFLRFPNGRTEVTLASLYAHRDLRNSDAFVFDKIFGPSGSTQEYEFTFTFSPRAGNRFQRLKTQFDLSVGIFSKPTGVCRNCVCFWRDFCCHPQNWFCRWTDYLFWFR